MDALIVAATDAQRWVIASAINKQKFDITMCDSGRIVRQAASQRPFHLVVVNSGLADEYGDELCKTLVENYEGGVIFIEDYRKAETAEYELGEYGVIVLPKPLSKAAFIQAVNVVYATETRIDKIKKRNEDLLVKLDDMRYINQAKIALVKALGYSEEQAHKFIERKAMDMRMTRRAVALDILKTYD